MKQQTINCLQGWSIFSSSASKIASKATENAIKIGGLATQKASVKKSENFWKSKFKNVKFNNIE